MEHCICDHIINLPYTQSHIFFAQHNTNIMYYIRGDEIYIYHITELFRTEIFLNSANKRMEHEMTKMGNFRELETEME